MFASERHDSLQRLESRRSDSRLFKFSVLTTGLLCLVVGVTEACLLPGLSWVAIAHVVGALSYVSLAFLASDLIRFEAMVAVVVGIGVPFLSFGILYSNGMGGSAPIWFAIFPVYALLFSRSSKMKVIYFGYTFLGLVTVLFCEIWWAEYFGPLHAQYPVVLSWLVTIFGIISIATHIYLYESKRRRMNWILSRQQKWLENSRRLAVAGTLAGSIAHEINTPIATIQMVAESTAEKVGTGPVADEVREQMELIVRVVKHVSKTVQSLLNLSRREAGEKLVHQDLQSLLDEVAVLTRLRFQRYGVEIRVRPENLGGLRLYCRPYEISQALIVLLNNSVDAVAKLPERWVELHIEQIKGNCEFRVTDSGGGIPTELSKKIFDPYFTTKDDGEGTGLGLAVASQFVKDHGGTLSYVPSQPHTTFLMSIPNTVERIQNEKVIGG